VRSRPESIRARSTPWTTRGRRLQTKRGSDVAGAATSTGFERCAEKVARATGVSSAAVSFGAAVFAIECFGGFLETGAALGTSGARAGGLAVTIAP
jgi:hypothetical protein